MEQLANGQKEAKFKDVFFRCQTFNEGIEMAAKALCVSRMELLNWFMSYQPTNPHDITSSYIFACRYKRQHDADLSFEKIAQKIGYQRTIVSASVKVAEVFGPAEIHSDMVISDYRTAAFTADPRAELNKIRNAKRKKSALTSHSKTMINRNPKKTSKVKERFISRAKTAYQLRKDGHSLSEISEKFQVSLPEVSILHRAGALPEELLQVCKSDDIRKSLSTADPVGFLKNKINPIYYWETAAKENIVADNTTMPMPMPDGFEAEQLRSLAFGILNMLTENKQVENQNQRQAEIIEGLKIEKQRLNSLINVMEKEIVNLKNQNGELQKSREKQVAQFRSKVHELSQFANMC